MYKVIYLSHSTHLELPSTFTMDNALAECEELKALGIPAFIDPV